MKHAVYKKVVLVIFDGLGVASSGKGNAVALAKVPTFDSAVARYPSGTLQASGPLVGLPWGEMGNSEVGHLNMGAGRIVGQDLPRITSSIQSGDFFRNPALLGAVNHTLERGSRLHLVGLVSPGGVHSLDEHLYALLGLAAERGQRNVFIHMFTDGRDTEEKIALESLEKLSAKIAEIGVGTVATVTGRFYGMDRGQHWNQTAATFDAIVSGLGDRYATAEECIRTSYSAGVFDEMIKPSVLTHGSDQPVGPVAPGDAVVFFNFRSDRALQLAQMFAQPQAVPEASRRLPPEDLALVSMTEYAPGLPIAAAFEPVSLQHNLAQVISEAGLKQFHIAETEKYAHVTAFFNCGRTEPFPGEDRVIVESPENNARNYVDRPEMSAKELTAALVEKIKDPSYSFCVANYANGDMVGHTGSLPGAVRAVECLDGCLRDVVEACLGAGAALLVTADHGNVEQMLNTKTGEIDKDHTTNPVPFLFIAQENRFEPPRLKTYQSLAAEVPVGVISDIAPTVLALLALPKPEEMTGVNLFTNFPEHG